jgi:hypothetical protein
MTIAKATARLPVVGFKDAKEGPELHVEWALTPWCRGVVDVSPKPIPHPD